MKPVAFAPRMLRRLSLAVTALAPLGAAIAYACAAPAAADDFLLAGGGRLSGQLANVDETPRTKYEIRLASGGVVTLAAEQVASVVRRTPEQIEYDKLRHEKPDTAEGHFELAEWCRDKKLAEERKTHLERAIELEPDHVKARAALGYNRIQGQWRTRAEHLSALGKVQYKGQWRYPQEVEIMEAKAKADLAKSTWYANLKRWRSWFGTPKQAEAIAALEGLTDPAAVPALKEYLDKEQDEDVRKYYVRGLAHIGSVPADLLLADRSLNDPSQEIRLTCLDYLDDVPQAMLVDYYIQQLRSTDNAVVNRAAVALSRFKDPRSISPLIEALVTTHKFAVTTGNSGGSLSAAQGTGGSGISMGSSTRIVTQKLENPGVLDALVTTLEGKVNYRYDLAAWKNWYAGQKKMRLLDVRRS